jgi:hypothetical protein
VVDIPRAKPTHVIVHRIELQESTKEMIEPFVKTKEVEQIAKSAAMIGAAGALGVGAYVAWWVTDSIFGWMDNAKDKIQAMKQQIKDYDNQNDTNYEDLAKSISPVSRLLWSVL